MIVSNAALLYLAQLCRLAIPILILPVVSRRLDLDQFAALGSAQALAYLVMIIPEYGFATYGPRAIAQVRGNAERIKEEASGILSAKLALTLIAIPFAVGAGLLLPTLQGDMRIIAGMVFLGIMLGMGPSWFFQGTGQTRFYAMLEIAALVAFLVLVLLVPFGPRDGWIPLALQAGTLAVAVIVGHVVLLASASVRLDQPRRIVLLLKEGFPLFLTKLGSNIPGLGLIYIIGFSLPSEAVAQYVAAERVLMGAANGLWPVMQILMPEIAELRRRSTAQADRLLRRGLVVLLCLGLLLGIVLHVLSPLIISLLFGQKFTPAVDALALIALALPCMALTNCISVGVLVARGHDWLLTWIILGAGAVSAGLALGLIGPNDFARVAMIRFGVEIGLVLVLTVAARMIIRREG